MAQIDPVFFPTPDQNGADNCRPNTLEVSRQWKMAEIWWKMKLVPTPLVPSPASRLPLPASFPSHLRLDCFSLYALACFFARCMFIICFASFGRVRSLHIQLSVYS